MVVQVGGQFTTLFFPQKPFPRIYDTVTYQILMHCFPVCLSYKWSLQGLTHCRKSLPKNMHNGIVAIAMVLLCSPLFIKYASLKEGLKTKHIHISKQTCRYMNTYTHIYMHVNPCNTQRSMHINTKTCKYAQTMYICLLTQRHPHTQIHMKN